jgi:RNA polymerase sigma-70 factor, ECF subfamily
MLPILTQSRTGIAMNLRPFSRRSTPKNDGEAGSGSAASDGGNIRESFEQLALPLLPSLYNYACWLTRNPAEAEDLVQETLAKAIRAFSSYQSGTNFTAWTMRILRNTFLTSRTGMTAARTVFLEDHPDALDTSDAGPTPEEHLIRLDNQAMVRAALEELEPHLREVLLLCDVKEMKYKEIALILDIPIGTVMSRIARARGALRRQLESRSSRSGEPQ